MEGREELPVLQKYELLDRIKQLEDLRYQALISFIYLTGARVEEVCKYIIEKNPKRIIKKEPAPILERTLKGQPILKKQITIDDEFMTIYNVRTLKRNKYIPRAIPILIKKEQKFMEIIKEYLNTLNEDDPLFPIVRSRAYQIMSKVGLFPHYLRHLRLTHLTIEYGFRVAELMEFTGWGSSHSADSYIHLNVANLKDRMKGG